MLEENKIKKETKRMTEINKIDGLVGAKEVGSIVDLYNENLDKSREKKYGEDMSDRNKYFAPLWQRAIEDIRLGKRVEKKKKYIQTIGDTGPKKILLPGGKQHIVK